VVYSSTCSCFLAPISSPHPSLHLQGPQRKLRPPLPWGGFPKVGSLRTVVPVSLGKASQTKWSQVSLLKLSDWKSIHRSQLTTCCCSEHLLASCAEFTSGGLTILSEFSWDCWSWKTLLWRSALLRCFCQQWRSPARPAGAHLLPQHRGGRGRGIVSSNPAWATQWDPVSKPTATKAKNNRRVAK
jgi:hypothetical protein